MSKQRIQLSDHFTYSRLLRFVLPCIGTMLFTSVYGIVDGLCVSNFVGKTAFAAVNLIMPLPLHDDRLRQRGFNQALELARPLAQARRLPLDTSSCRRVRDTPARPPAVRARR